VTLRALPGDGEDSSPAGAGRVDVEGTDLLHPHPNCVPNHRGDSCTCARLTVKKDLAPALKHRFRKGAAPAVYSAGARSKIEN
jgi:hypothetical protein